MVSVVVRSLNRIVPRVLSGANTSVTMFPENTTVEPPFIKMTGLSVSPEL